ncbi:MAG: chemotaxis protein CheX [Epsilonproteobacteria bacterium]|nr:chemotaxis protein CheX [Campylobacterota bacterium]
MRAVVKNGIGVFYPQGFLDGNSVASLISVDDIDATLKLNVDMVLVSLKRVIFFNRNGLDQFVKMFAKLRQEKHTVVGFCDYDDRKYQAIQKFYNKEMTFSLFKTLSIAELFSNHFNNQNKTVLVWSEDKSQRAAMAIELHDRGHNPIVAQTLEDFQEKSEAQELYDVVIDSSYLGDMGQQIAARVTSNAVIYTVSEFLDNTIASQFNIEYHNNSLNVGFRLFIFDAYKVVSMNVHAVNFFAKLASAAAEYNATICFVGLSFEKIPKRFKEEMEDSGILFFESMDDILGNKDLLHDLGAASAVNKKNQRMINKKIVSHLPQFVDAIVTTLEMMTNAKAIKEAVKIEKIILTQKENDLLASSIGFYDDMDGIIVLVFPKNIAKKACELLIGEETNDEELILDSLAELVNIVGGKLKTLLSDIKVNISITLPRTYNNIDDVLEVIGEKKGVQVDLKFDNDHFTFFLTR